MFFYETFLLHETNWFFSCFFKNNTKTIIENVESILDMNIEREFPLHVAIWNNETEKLAELIRENKVSRSGFSWF